MRNNIQNDVKVEKAKNYLSKFNMSRSISTSASIGRVNVGWAQYMIPGSKALVSEEQLVRMAPMVAPTYAKQKFKTWHTFIPFADIFKNFDAMMSEQTISRNGTLINPLSVPHISTRVLFALACTGAKFTIYLQQYDGTAHYNENMQTAMINKYSGGVDGVYRQTIDYIVSNAFGWEAGSLEEGPKINVGRIFNLSDQNMKVDSGNKTFSSFVLPDDDGTMPPWYNYETAGYDVLNPVTLEGADFLYQIPRFNVPTSSVPNIGGNGDWTITIAIRLSSWGQAYTNTLRALGYVIDPSSDESVSVLPLLAAYKAYWDIFGLALWQNFESTSCGRFITLCENLADVDVYATSGAWNRFKSFILDELGAMWLTEQNDYISAHLPQPVISEPSKMVDFVDVTGSLNISEPIDNDYAHPNQPQHSQPDGHAFTTSVQHGALDCELLKRLYKWTNRNTALGKNIARLLNAQGLGTYMERTRCNFIGDTSMDIDVTSVTSVADTFDDATKQGKMLGSYSGKGVGYKEHGKKLYYSTDCFGVWICLTAVTCDSGYSQGADLLNQSIKPEHFYRPDFDGLGLEIHDKSVVAGQVDCSIYGYSQPPSHLPFGYAPRYSSWKVARNIVNGGFALRSMRKNFIPYNMDKLIYPEQVDCTDITSINPPSSSGIFAGGEKHLMCRTLPAQDIPTAGNAWRYLGRYPWMANLNRIFANVGETMPADLYTGSISAGLAKYWEYRYLTDDNYMVFEDVVFKYWAPMLPIEETYGTIDPDAKQLEYIDRV